MAKAFKWPTPEETERSFKNQVLDEDEQQSAKDLADGVYVLSPNQDERLKEWREAVKNTKRKRPVTIRIADDVVGFMKIRALEEGIPYQTLVNSILHKYATGRLKELD
jgi:predicted DNA binding CopG/RHH family protein